MGKPQSVGGLGWGDGTVALAFTIVIFCLVAYLAVTRSDVQSVKRVPQTSAEARLRVVEPSPEDLD
jgi:hypothetical protein